MNEVKKGAMLYEGKTKKIWSVEGDDNLVILENTDNITANDNPDLTRDFKSKAVSATRTTCNVFKLLRDAGLPVAFIGQISETEFLAPKCTMIPIEVVARRFAVGSYLKRHPELKQEVGAPYLFNRLAVEFFLKTTKGALTVNGVTIVDNLDPNAGEEDPLILDAYASEWKLFHAKRPHWDLPADLSQNSDAPADPPRIIGPKAISLILLSDQEIIAEMERLTRQCFLVLEKAWAMLGHRLIDFKIEFGIDSDGTLYIADVIDNDSWRLRTSDWQELSKQLFRDGVELAKVEEAYLIVAQLTDRFRIPKQALVLWKGSEKDDVPDIPDIEQLEIMGITLVIFAKSGHKATMGSLASLFKMRSSFPEGGVIVAAVGRSNGLGPVLAAHTDWPVIALPLTADKFPDDIWSSLRMPSNVPLSTVWPAANAFQFALNILGQSNPAAYAHQRLALEELDK